VILVHEAPSLCTRTCSAAQLGEGSVIQVLKACLKIRSNSTDKKAKPCKAITINLICMGCSVCWSWLALRSALQNTSICIAFPPLPVCRTSLWWFAQPRKTACTASPCNTAWY